PRDRSSLPRAECSPKPAGPSPPRATRAPTEPWTGPRGRVTVRIEVGARRTGVMDPETQIAAWFAQYDAPIAKVGKALRAKVRARLPGLTELVYVYERQGSLVFSYSPTEAGAAGVAGVAVY